MVRGGPPRPRLQVAAGHRGKAGAQPGLEPPGVAGTGRGRPGAARDRAALGPSSWDRPIPPRPRRLPAGNRFAPTTITPTVSRCRRGSRPGFPLAPRAQRSPSSVRGRCGTGSSVQPEGLSTDLSTNSTSADDCGQSPGHRCPSWTAGQAADSSGAGPDPRWSALGRSGRARERSAAGAQRREDGLLLERQLLGVEDRVHRAAAAPLLPAAAPGSAEHEGGPRTRDARRAELAAHGAGQVARDRAGRDPCP